ncbi:hypothetical protein AYL99_06455 [Fonsecaea erecta]|uniref:Inhibitor of growth protein N-terminal histone-binding domain-containing protein n=1 Tax=Fonsecaea erecta TaxID=1367422 RepID=A0A178ZH79_9EURO|nr:hypothetical protein AYL99_06455 [Fonsecaea erecta]OAP59157.1 hypothetical protein AYL99_06455 [Fonsecaea erecta]
MAEIASNRAVDPDAQAAVTDFLDYTEYLPSDLIRSLTLIRGLDDTYLNSSSTLNDLTKLYGSLPNIAPPLRPNVQELRAQISTSLDQALNARESAYAEACRLFDVVERHHNRLRSIIAKLNAIPKPPSRDPTPQPTPSSQVKRSRSGRKIETGTSTRLTLHPPRGSAVASAILKRPRGRRVTVPGDVMPPYDPDSPIASTEVSDWESPPSSPPRPVLKLKQPKPQAPPKLPKQKPLPRDEKTRESREATEPYHKPTPPPEDAEIGSKYRPWTHLTEYEMYRLRKKMKKNHAWEPSDVMIRRELADRGRGWDNYYRAKAEAQANGTRFIDIDSIEKLTPKDERADKLQTEILDQVESVEKPDAADTVGKAEEVDIPTQEPEVVDKSEESAAGPSGTPAPKTKSTKKNEKKEKKPDPARSQAALAAQEAELAARRLGDIGSKFRTLFTTPFTSALASLSRSASTPVATNRAITTGRKGTEKTSRKRKAEDTPTSSVSPSVEPEAARKKQKIAPKPSPLAVSPVPVTTPTSPAATSSEPPPSTSTGTIKIPLKLNVAAAAAAPSPGIASANASKTPTPAPTTRAPSVQRNSVAPKPETTPPASTTASSRPPSRRSAAASVEPQLPTARSSRRASITPSLVGGQKTPAEREAQGPSPKAIIAVPTAASRRSKRDAPGTVMQSSQDGGAAVSVSKRKTKPAKKSSSTAQIPQIRIDVDGRQEIVDPDEERGRVGVLHFTPPVARNVEALEERIFDFRGGKFSSVVLALIN